MMIKLGEFFYVTLPENNGHRTRKWMVGIRLFPFRMAYFQGRTVSFREGISSASPICLVKGCGLLFSLYYIVTNVGRQWGHPHHLLHIPLLQEDSFELLRSQAVILMIRRLSQKADAEKKTGGNERQQSQRRQ